MAVTKPSALQKFGNRYCFHLQGGIGKVKVKQSRYRPRVAQRVPGS